MNRKILICLSIILSCELLFGASGFGGARGLFRIQDAQNEGANMVSVSSRYIFRRERVGGKGQYYGPFLLPEFGYSPTNYLEFTASLAGTFTYQVLPYRDFRYDWQGEMFGAKVSFAELPVAKFGVTGFLNVARANKSFLDSVILPGPGYRALITLDFSDAFLSLPCFVINAGETFGKDRMLFLGAGMEIASKIFSGVLEFNAEQKWQDRFLGSNTKLRITPGIKVRFPFGLGLEGGIEFGLNATTPDYTAILGINYLSPLVPGRPTPYGIITGKVVDGSTGLPVPATVKILKRRYATVRTDPNTGIFTIRNVPVGVVILEVKNEDYYAQALPLTVEQDKATTVKFELKKKKPVGAIAGVVTDATNDRPLQVTIALEGGTVRDIQTDPITGFYKLQNVPVGVHTIYTKKDGYVSAYGVVEVKEDETAIKNFQVVASGARFVLQGIKFDFNQATIRPESYPILDNIAKILKENPGIIVEIQGYTDNSGSFTYNQKLSLKRAQAVLNYLVEKHNIEPSRLFAQGYGELNPISSNETRAGRIMNRRVEFFVVGERK
ncbi:MAG: OmpA family protein [candidate division WOR-3 bacterium]